MFALVIGILLGFIALVVVIISLQILFEDGDEFGPVILLVIVAVICGSGSYLCLSDKHDGGKEMPAVRYVLNVRKVEGADKHDVQIEIDADGNFVGETEKNAEPAPAPEPVPEPAPAPKKPKPKGDPI